VKLTFKSTSRQFVKEPVSASKHLDNQNKLSFSELAKEKIVAAESN